jgi:uncharacterized protein involved in exopolysaccharide biosynthesis/Mrp family chromosome partitioning ATPase
VVQVSIRHPELANTATLNAPYPGRFAGAADASAIDLGQLLEVLRARWMIIAAFVAVCVGLGGLVVVMTPKTYTATVSILLDSAPRGTPGSEASLQPSTPDSTLIDTQVRVFASDVVLRRVAQQENLGDDPEFVSTAPGLRQRLMALIGIGKTAGDTARDRVSQATGALLRAVTVKRSEKTYVVDVDVSTRDPEKSARLANAIAGAYLADKRAASSQTNRRDTAWLNQRITELQTRLLEAENRAQDFRARNNLVDANGKNLVEQDLAEAFADVAKAKGRVADAKARADMLRTAVATGRIPELGDVTRYASLERLRAQATDLGRQEANLRTTLGERHPALRELQSQIATVRQQMTQEMRRIADLAQADYQMAERAAAETDRRVGAAREATQRANQVMVRLRDLERDVEASRDVYQKFLRSREALADDGGDGLTARVIAPAQVPAAPSAPKTAAIMFVALAAGLFFGSGGALAADYIVGLRPAPVSRRGAPIGRSTKLEAVGSDDSTDLQVLGTFPRVASWRVSLGRLLDFMLLSKAETSRSRYNLLIEADRNPSGGIARSARELYVALAGRPVRRTNRTSSIVLVAAVEAGAGTSVTASSLAFVAASAGRSVLLIDGNPEAPALTALIAPNARANLIDLHGSFRPIYHVEGTSGIIDVVPILANEEEVCFRIAQDHAYEPIAGINGHYDFVVIDGPALRGTEDDRDLVAAADRLVLVARDGTQGNISIEDLLEDLGLAPAKFAGTVLTKSARTAA